MIGAEHVMGLAEAIRELGWGRPILARPSDRVIIAGHRAHAAAAWLRANDPAHAELRVPVWWRECSDDTLARLGLADNAHAERGVWDYDGLGALLRELGDGVEVLGFTNDALGVLLHDMGADGPIPEPPIEPEPPPAVEPEPPPAVEPEHVKVCKACRRPL